MNERQLNSTNYPYQVLLTQTDHVTGAVGLSPTLSISKNGGAFAPAAGAITEVGNGWYTWAANATDRNALGTVAIHVPATVSNDAFDGKMVIVGYDPFDPKLGIPGIPSVAPGQAGGLPTVDANNAVKVSAGTGPNQLSIANGVVAATATMGQLPSNGLDLISIEAGVNLRQALSGIFAAALGLLSGAGQGGSVTITGGGNTTPRATVSTDSNGNRTAVSLTLPT